LPGGERHYGRRHTSHLPRRRPAIRGPAGCRSRTSRRTARPVNHGHRGPSSRYRRAAPHLWEINGNEGDLLVTGDSGHLQFGQVTIHGARGGTTELPVPPSYDTSVRALANARDTMAYTVAHAYAQLHADLSENTHTVPDFHDVAGLDLRGAGTPSWYIAVEL
jgi:hypothetical protein